MVRLEKVKKELMRLHWRHSEYGQACRGLGILNSVGILVKGSSHQGMSNGPKERRSV